MHTNGQNDHVKILVFRTCNAAPPHNFGFILFSPSTHIYTNRLCCRITPGVCVTLMETIPSLTNAFVPKGKKNVGTPWW